MMNVFFLLSYGSGTAKKTLIFTFNILYLGTSATQALSQSRNYNVGLTKFFLLVNVNLNIIIILSLQECLSTLEFIS